MNKFYTWDVPIDKVFFRNPRRRRQRKEIKHSNLLENTMFYEHGKKVFIPDYIPDTDDTRPSRPQKQLHPVAWRPLKGETGVKRRSLADYD